MFIRDKLIGSIPIDVKLSGNPQYIFQKKKELEEMYKEAVEQSDVVPAYYLETRTSTDKRNRK